MLMVYMNYPAPRITVHHDLTCGAIQKMAKTGQRRVRIAPETITVEFARFSRKEYTFAANQDENDMWLEIDFDDAEFERAVLKYIHCLIGANYTPLARVEIATHC